MPFKDLNLKNISAEHTGHLWTHRERITPKAIMNAQARGRVFTPRTTPMCRLLITRKEKGGLEAWAWKPMLQMVVNRSQLPQDTKELFQLAQNNFGGLLLDIPYGPQADPVVRAFLTSLDSELGIQS